MTDGNPLHAGTPADLLLLNGRVATQDDPQSFVNALAIKKRAHSRDRRHQNDHSPQRSRDPRGGGGGRAQAGRRALAR